MTASQGQGQDDAASLLMRVDELTGILAAVSRVVSRSRFTQPALRIDRMTEQQLAAALDSVASDLDALRAHGAALDRQRRELAVSLVAAKREIEAKDADLESMRERLAAADEHLARLDEHATSAMAVARTWQEESQQLRVHRDEVVAALLAVQGSRWMRLGRTLQVVRRTGVPDGS
ncbi:MAG: hypothetical protein PHU75_00255 [Candidatus Nanopelagicales bacterium]|nr:hypothetical protein [Candidatus Nanopelagicales bacterium]